VGNEIFPSTAWKGLPRLCRCRFGKCFALEHSTAPLHSVTACPRCRRDPALGPAHPHIPTSPRPHHGPLCVNKRPSRTVAGGPLAREAAERSALALNRYLWEVLHPNVHLDDTTKKGTVSIAL
jgi:hypothetical protein